MEGKDAAGEGNVGFCKDSLRSGTIPCFNIFAFKLSCPTTSAVKLNSVLAKLAGQWLNLRGLDQTSQCVHLQLRAYRLSSGCVSFTQFSCSPSEAADDGSAMPVLTLSTHKCCPPHVIPAVAR